MLAPNGITVPNVLLQRLDDEVLTTSEGDTVLGPIEVLVIAFPGNQFNGTIVPALSDLVDADTISIIDALLVSKDETGEVSFVEFDEVGVNEDAAALATLFERSDGLLSDDDVDELSADLANNSSAAILVFEHTWFKPLRDAIVGSGGILLEDVHMPGAVADEVLIAGKSSGADTD